MESMEDRMLEAIDEEQLTPEQEYNKVKESFEKTTIKAYGIELECCQYCVGEYYAYGFIWLDSKKCAALKGTDSIQIFIKRKWFKETDVVKMKTSSMRAVDYFELTYYHKNEKVLEYYTNNAIDELQKATDKVLSMIEIVRKGNDEL